jgi:hypothetical protein
MPLTLTNHCHCLIARLGAPYQIKIGEKMCPITRLFFWSDNEEEPSGKNRFTPVPSPPTTGADQGSKQSLPRHPSSRTSLREE